MSWMNSAPHLISLISLFIMACQPSHLQPVSDNLEAIPIVAPISENLRIGEVSFTDKNKTKPHANIFASSLEGYVRVLIEDYRKKSLEGFNFHIHWTLINSTGKAVLSDRLEHQSHTPSYKLWLDLPLRGNAPAGTYLLAIQFFENKREESFGYQQELIVAERITDELR